MFIPAILPPVPPIHLTPDQQNGLLVLTQFSQIIYNILAPLSVVVAAFTYLSSEKWKKGEFLSDLIDKFSTDPLVKKALIMIEWRIRKLQLLEGVPFEKSWVTITRRSQVLSLLPSPLVRFSDVISTGDVATGELISPSGHYKGNFDHVDYAVRDCYDAFLSNVARISGYLKSGHFKVSSLRPGLGYWVDFISEKTDDPDRAAWGAALLTYITYYGYSEVIYLFDRFGKDISAGSELHRSFLKRMEDQALAAKLAQTVGFDYGSD